MITNNVPKGISRLPEVSVIIVNYNGLKFISDCIKSLKTYLSEYEFEIVIVDNLSTDGSREFLEKTQGIIYVASNKNLGFTGGNNLGAMYARGDFLLFINNDTVVETSLSPLLQTLNNINVGISSCRLLYGDKRQQFSIGYDHTPLRVIFSWMGLEKLHCLPKVFRKLETNPETYKAHHQSLDWVSGACFAIKKDIWNKVGGFDVNIFMYCEDVDLCVRVRRLGLNIAYTPDSIVTHYEGAGRPWIGEAALRRTTDSYLYFIKKHYGRVWLYFVAYSLATIFFTRFLIFGLNSFLSNNKKVSRDKSKAYLTISVYTLRKITNNLLRVD